MVSSQKVRPVSRLFVSLPASCMGSQHKLCRMRKAERHLGKGKGLCMTRQDKQGNSSPHHCPLVFLWRQAEWFTHAPLLPAALALLSHEESCGGGGFFWRLCLTLWAVTNSGGGACHGACAAECCEAVGRVRRLRRLPSREFRDGYQIY